MTRPRSEQVCVTDTPWYHVVSRCVRRAFLCGEDRFTGRNFDHRRGWIEARMRQLSAVFAVDVAAYAVMSNHYHIVLRLDPGRAEGWTEEEVLRRWTALFSGPMLVRRYLDTRQRPVMTAAEQARVREWAETYRARLVDLSWYMRVLNESIARQANAEDGVKGRFWEGRFKSQALLDDQAILSAMAYVDLNPIRAGIARTPEESDYTSVEARLRPEEVQYRMQAALQVGRKAADPDNDPATPRDGQPPEPALHGEGTLSPLPIAPLMPFDATARESWAIPFAWADYLDLVETLGRCVHPAKKGFIPEHTPRLLVRLGMDAEAFIAQSSSFLQAFGQAVGTPERLVQRAAQRQVRFLRGMETARRVFQRRCDSRSPGTESAPAERSAAG